MISAVEANFDAFLRELGMTRFVVYPCPNWQQAAVAAEHVLGAGGRLPWQQKLQGADVMFEACTEPLPCALLKLRLADTITSGLSGAARLRRTMASWGVAAWQRFGRRRLHNRELCPFPRCFRSLWAGAARQHLRSDGLAASGAYFRLTRQVLDAKS